MGHRDKPGDDEVWVCCEAFRYSVTTTSPVMLGWRLQK